MIRVGAGTQHKKRKNSRPKIPLESSASCCDQNFSSAFALKKTPKSFPLDTQYTSKKTKEMVKITKSTRSLYLSFSSFSLLLSLSFVPTMLRFLRVRVFFLSLSFRAAFVRAFVCARLCVSSGLIFVSEFCFHLNHKFSSRALSYVLTLFPLFIIFSFSLLHRRRLRRWADHGHDRSEVPAHRGNEHFFVRDDDLMQSAGEKETMDSHNLLSRLSRKIAKFV